MWNLLAIGLGDGELPGIFKRKTMGQNQKKRIKSQERKNAKRKEKKKAVVKAATPNERSLYRAAAKWPLIECLISKKWGSTEDIAPTITQILVARESQGGKIAAGIFLVDTGCLGVKNSSARVFFSQTEYGELVRSMKDSQELIKADLDLVAKVIDSSIEYAKKWGFQPHRDFKETSLILTGANPDACEVEVPLGYKGKPFFFAGPYDNIPLCLAKLEKTAGAGNFDYIAFTGDPFDDVFDDDNDFDEDELDEDEEEWEEGGDIIEGELVKPDK
jgi:hypothetical protein